MNRIRRLTRLVGVCAIAVGGPGCAFLDPWEEDEFDGHEFEVSRMPAEQTNPPPLHTLEPGVYREAK